HLTAGEALRMLNEEVAHMLGAEAQNGGMAKQVDGRQGAEGPLRAADEVERGADELQRVAKIRQTFRAGRQAVRILHLFVLRLTCSAAMAALLQTVRHTGCEPLS